MYAHINMYLILLHVHTTWDTCAVHVYVRVHVFYDLQLLLVEWHSEKSLIEKDIVIVDCCCG